MAQTAMPRLDPETIDMERAVKHNLLLSWRLGRMHVSSRTAWKDLVNEQYEKAIRSTQHMHTIVRRPDPKVRFGHQARFGHRSQ